MPNFQGILISQFKLQKAKRIGTHFCLGQFIRLTRGPSRQLRSLQLEQTWYISFSLEFSNIPLEHTPDPQPTIYKGLLHIWGLGYAPGVC